MNRIIHVLGHYLDHAFVKIEPKNIIEELIYHAVFISSKDLLELSSIHKSFYIPMVDEMKGLHKQAIK